MQDENNAAIPVIVGVVGGVEELASLKPVFDEFRSTLGDSTLVKVMLADGSGEIKLFDAGFPQSSSWHHLSSCGEGDIAQDVATYLLRNCHFVLLAATLGKFQSIRCAVEACAVEFPAEITAAEAENISVLDLPEPAPVLAQVVANSLNVEIVKREILPYADQSQSAEHAEIAGKSKPDKSFKLALFEYDETAFRKFWRGLVKKPLAKYISHNREKPLTFLHDAKDAMGRRWLDCVKAIHRQVAFNDEVWSNSDVKQHQIDRFGFQSVDKVSNDPDYHLRDLFLVQCKADIMATQYQDNWQKLRFAKTEDIANKSWHLRQLGSFLWLGVFSAFLFVFSTEFGGLFGGWSNIFASVGYGIILLSSFVRYMRARKQAWEQKHQDYRFIAEVLAIQLHWMLGGIKKYASNHFPSGVKSDVQWVRRAVHTCRFLSKIKETSSILPFNTVCETWVARQSKWHKETFQTGREKTLDTLKKWRGHAGICFVLSFLLFIAFTVCTGLSLWQGGLVNQLQQRTQNIAVHDGESKQDDVHATHISVVEHTEAVIPASVVEGPARVEEYGNGHDIERWKEVFHHSLIVAMVTFLVLFALFGEVIEGYGIEQELTRSEILVEMYDRCLREFKKLSFDDSKKQELLIDVGRFAIEAEAGWLIIHRERPMQPVKGG